jgi:hypothetical protein
VPERFELSDEAFGGAVGILAGVVVAAEVVVTAVGHSILTAAWHMLQTGEI